MRVLIAAVGSRGDVAPYTGLGAGLAAAGHEVTLAAHEPFEQDVRTAGLEFAPLGGDVRAQVAAPADGRRPSPRFLAQRVGRLTEYLRLAATDAMTAAERDTDVVLFNGSALFGDAIAAGLGVPALGVFGQPIEPTAAFPPILANSARSLGGWGNRLAGQVVLRMLTPFHRASALVRERYGLPATRELVRRSTRVLHGYSPAVLPRPADWRPGLDVVGYWWPYRPADWSPAAELTDFLAAGPVPVFVGFGSMAGGQSGWLAELTVAAVREAGVRAIVQAGWADLSVAGSDVLVAGPDVLVVGEVPYEWLFPQVAAVVHHGGAGTTAAGLKAGRPSVLTPVYADQPLWAARVHALGVGPAPLPLRHLTAPALASALRAVGSEEGYRVAAAGLARRIATEDGVRAVVAALRN